jgi:hypothetical protein
MKHLGKVGQRRAANLERWKRTHPVPECCPECGMAHDWRGFSIHHKTKRSQGGDESEDNLTWLCGRCHQKYDP